MAPHLSALLEAPDVLCQSRAVPRLLLLPRVGVTVVAGCSGAAPSCVLPCVEQPRHGLLFCNEKEQMVNLCCPTGDPCPVWGRCLCGFRCWESPFALWSFTRVLGLLDIPSLILGM